MGGKGSGGFRIGAGRKPKEAASVRLHGGKRRRSVAGRQAVPVATEPVAVPVDLPSEEQAVWNLLAPLAQSALTLTPATAEAFALLCRNVVTERALRAAGAGSPDHRGMVRLVEISMARFCLAPNGKAIVQTEAPKDEWAEFDVTGPQLVKKGA